MCHHTWLIFVFLVETGFLHVGQVGLQLSTSGNLTASASQSAGITGVSHLPCPWFQLPKCVKLLPPFLLHSLPPSLPSSLPSFPGSHSIAQAGVQ